MNKLVPIKIPLLNPNEPEALLSSLEISTGAPIEKGDLIAVIETTKSTGEVYAEADGYLVGVRFTPGDSLTAGDVMGYIGPSPDAQDPTLPPWSTLQTPPATTERSPSGLRITAPARQLALQAGLDLSTLPHGPLVTEKMIRDRLAFKRIPTKVEIPEGETRLLIYGAGGHGRSLAALIRTLGHFTLVGFIDDGYQVGEEILGLEILGGKETLPKLFARGIRLCVNGVGGIGDLQSRLAVYETLLTEGFICPSVVHPTAFVEDSAELAQGLQAFPFAYIGTEVQVGYGSIINSGAIVSHNCVLEPYINLSPGATLAGGVVVEEGALIGMRATINLNVHIGKRARIGNGATVKGDVPAGGVVPAGTIWPPRH